MNIQVKCEDEVSPVLIGVTEEEYFVVLVDSGEDEESIHTDEHPICDEDDCPCKQQVM